MKKQAIIKEEEKGGLWLVVNGGEIAWPIEVDEVEPIMNACKEYMEKNLLDKITK